MNNLAHGHTGKGILAGLAVGLNGYVIRSIFVGWAKYRRETEEGADPDRWKVRRRRKSRVGLGLSACGVVIFGLIAIGSFKSRSPLVGAVALVFVILCLGELGRAARYRRRRD